MSSEQACLIYRDKRFDTTRLNQLIAHIESYLQTLEQESSRVFHRLAIKSHSRWLNTILLYVTAASGRSCFPLAEDLSAEQLKEQCISAAVDVLICDDAPVDAELMFIDSQQLLNRVEHGLNDDGQKDYGPSLAPETAIHPDFKLIIATSGTTAEAKLVLLDRNNILAHVEAIQDRLQLNPGHCWLNCLPLYSIAGVMILFRCWLSGAGHQLLDGFDADRVWQLIQQEQISHLSLVPVMLRRLVDQAGQESIPSSLKLCLVGGDQLSESLFTQANQAGWPVLISYGMTETTSTLALSEDNRHYQLLKGFEIRCDEMGRLQLKGAAVMTGYYLNQEHQNTGLRNSSWLSTQDRGEIVDQGFILSGRLDESFTSGGQTRSLAWVEAMIKACPVLEQYRLVTVKHDDWGDTLVLFAEYDLGAIKAWCQNNLPSLARPRYFFSLDQLPVNHMGKLQRQKLCQMVAEYGGIEPEVSPQKS